MENDHPNTFVNLFAVYPLQLYVPSIWSSGSLSASLSSITLSIHSFSHLPQCYHRLIYHSAPLTTSQWHSHPFPATFGFHIHLKLVQFLRHLTYACHVFSLMLCTSNSFYRQLAHMAHMPFVMVCQEKPAHPLVWWSFTPTRKYNPLKFSV